MGIAPLPFDGSGSDPEHAFHGETNRAERTVIAIRVPRWNEPRHPFSTNVLPPWQPDHAKRGFRRFSGCHELRIVDKNRSWRIVYRVDTDAILIVEVFAKTTQATPKPIIDLCKRRLAAYDLAAR